MKSILFAFAASKSLLESPTYKDLFRSHLKSDNNVAILSFFSIGEPNIILKNESIPRPLQTSLNYFFIQ